METTLEFNADDVMRVCLHSLESEVQYPFAYTEEEVTEPAIILVHDEGVYLMSNGDPRDILTPGGNRSFAAYAAGCHPDRDDNWWEFARELVGGDDFAETIPAAEEFLEAARNAKKKGEPVKVLLTEQDIKLV